MHSPNLIYADKNGNIYNHPKLGLVGSAAGKWEPINESHCITLPKGSELFLLPGRLPVGVVLSNNGKNKHNYFEILEKDPLNHNQSVTAVAAFIAPAHTAHLNAAWHTTPQAPILPLFAYTAVGFIHGRFVVAAQRIDSSPRQDNTNFPNLKNITIRTKKLMHQFKNNRLWQHLAKCALTNCCPAAKNLILGRWEAPLPTSTICNASCLGCLSKQDEGIFPATQNRISFTPTVKEAVEIALYHFKKGHAHLISFGQGCEGEPLLKTELLAEIIHLIRKKYPKNTININSNGSLPNNAKILLRKGITSMRISLNSLIPQRHAAYYRPKGWSLSDVIKTITTVKQYGGFCSINLLCFPGLTDRPEEIEALELLIKKTKLDLIQWRNLNIDPEFYLKKITISSSKKHIGINNLIQRLKSTFPWLKHGYYNPKI